MIDEKIYKRIVEFCGDFDIDSYTGPNVIRMYAYLFKELTHGSYEMCGEAGNLSFFDAFTSSTDDNQFNENKCSVELEPTYANIIAAVDGTMFSLSSNIVYIAADDLIIRINTAPEKNSILRINIATNHRDIKELEKMFNECIVFNEHKNRENSYKIAFRGQYSIDTTTSKFNNWTCDIKRNYNDDLPYGEMNEIIRDSNKAGLMLLYGKPGTGKTSLIKSLINDNPKVDFIFIDSSVCDSISNGIFLEFLQDNKNAVFIFEDCEKLLQSREEGVNNQMGTILNLTDGIIAESMKIKFICTFNCDLDKVDTALLRKGRLSLKYEFKELSLEKCKKISEKADKSMTLAELYNLEHKNDFSEKRNRKIGF